MVPFAEVLELLVSAFIVPSGSCRMVDMDLEELVYYRAFRRYPVEETRGIEETVHGCLLNNSFSTHE